MNKSLKNTKYLPRHLNLLCSIIVSFLYIFNFQVLCVSMTSLSHLILSHLIFWIYNFCFNCPLLQLSPVRPIHLRWNSFPALFHIWAVSQAAAYAWESRVQVFWKYDIIILPNFLNISFVTTAPCYNCPRSPLDMSLHSNLHEFINALNLGITIIQAICEARSIKH